MPYVPSKKTVPPAEDREILNPLVEVLAEKAASEIKENRDLIPVYRSIFKAVGERLEQMVHGTMGGDSHALYMPEEKLAQAIYGLRKKYDYDGAEDGELNYSFTRFIQRVPQIKVKRGDWPAKNELRYWSYARACHALLVVALHFKDSELGLMGVYNDIEEEYKWRVNRPYEAAQIVKSGDCYDTPFYTKLMAVRDTKGKVICHIDGYFERSEETLNKDVVDWELVAVPKKKAQSKKK